MKVYSITQDDIDNNMTTAVMDNNAASETGVAMIGDVTKIIFDFLLFSLLTGKRFADIV